VIRVAIVDDDAMVRTGLGLILGGPPDITVVGQAGDGAAALTLLDGTEVDVVLLDIRMPGMDGLATLAALKERPSRPKVVVLTTFNTDDYVLRALALGAEGFLLKDADPKRLVDAVRRVHAGEPMLAPEVTSTLIAVATETPRPDPATRAGIASLTPREREVAVLVARGLTNSQIGTRLNMSLATVKANLTRVFVKLGVDNRVSAAMAVRDARVDRG
jgi:DNA-binding NarL/FixJ family response regulator